MSERTVVEYGRPNPRPRWQAGSMSVVLVLFQFLWMCPAAFGASVTVVERSSATGWDKSAGSKRQLKEVGQAHAASPLTC